MLPASLTAEPPRRVETERRAVGAESNRERRSSALIRSRPGARLADHDLHPSTAWLEALDLIEGIGAGETAVPGRAARIDEDDCRALAALDRAGLAPSALVALAALPDHTDWAAAERLAILHREGLVARHPVRMRPHAGLLAPPLYSITAAGVNAAQSHDPPTVSKRRRWRAVERESPSELAKELRALAWALALRRTAGALGTDNWRTRRYATGRYPVPRGADGQPITLREIALPAELELADVPSELAEVAPAVSLELRAAASGPSVELLADVVSEETEIDPTLRSYDAFLAGWCLADPRFARGERPAIVLICPSVRAALHLARRADEVLRGRSAGRRTRRRAGGTRLASRSGSRWRARSITTIPPRSRCRHGHSRDSSRSSSCLGRDEHRLERSRTRSVRPHDPRVP